MTWKWYNKALIYFAEGTAERRTEKTSETFLHQTFSRSHMEVRCDWLFTYTTELEQRTRLKLRPVLQSVGIIQGCG